jgi:hypothetical protein
MIKTAHVKHVKKGSQNQFSSSSFPAALAITVISLIVNIPLNVIAFEECGEEKERHTFSIIFNL